MKKFTLMVLLLVIITGQTFAQNFQWTKSAGGTSYDEGYGVAIDQGSQNVYITGNFHSPTLMFGATTLTNVGQTNNFLVKYNPSGNVLWAKSFGGAGYSYANGISANCNGWVCVTGSFDGSITIGGITLSSVGGQDIFVAQFDSSGNVLWAKQAGGGSNDHAFSVYSDCNGVNITGDYYSSTANFAATTLTNTDASGTTPDMFIARYDPYTGNLSWVKSAGSNSTIDKGNSVACDYNAAGIFVSGDFGGTNLRRYDLNGNLVWAKTGASGTVTSYSFPIFAEYVAGQFSGTVSFGTTTLTSNGVLPDIFIAKYDLFGNVIWAKKFGGANADQASSIFCDALGNFYVSGTFKSDTVQFGNTNSTMVNTTGGAGKMFVARFDTAGKAFWAESVASTAGFFNSSYITTFQNGKTAYATGIFSASTTFGNTTLNSNAGSNDVFLTKIFSCNTTPPNICMVTVDTLSHDSLAQNNIIFWDKTAYNTGDTFIVYRDTANNNYAPIGKVPFDSLSQFVDTVRTLYAANGDPDVSSWRYKLAVKDSCGATTAMSPYHQSMFFQNNAGNFTWNHYQIEGQATPVPALSNYRFKRDTISNGAWSTIQTLSASSVAYTDPNYSTYQATGTWRVETAWTINCNPTFKISPAAMNLVATSRSNIRNNLAHLGMSNFITEKDFILMPNPAQDLITISSKSSLKNLTIEISDITGRVIQREKNSENENRILISTQNLNNGIYLLKLKNENGGTMKKLVIER